MCIRYVRKWNIREQWNKIQKGYGTIVEYNFYMATPYRAIILGGATSSKAASP